ncbi:MAG: hypothetical protein A2Y38_03335 [Spirochaetes bacterium GWB1_59_5]|nr:MAG: hypothetical protein A2Y38_03335 [Spirochaetes bacterium GWB1_59_5]
MSWTNCLCDENAEHDDIYSECLMCAISRLVEENRLLGDQVARLQSSTGACEMIRKDQRIERLEEENETLRDKLWWARDRG